MSSIYDIVLLLLLVASAVAFDLQQSSHDIQSNRGIGLEEIVLFLVGLGVASALGLAIVIGPLLALFYTSLGGIPFGGINGSNTVSTTVGGSRVFEANTIKKHLLEKLTEGVGILEDALKKYHKV